MPTFSGSTLRLEAVSQIAAATLRVRFTQDPLAANSAGINDALNVANYSLSGPGINVLLSCNVVYGDPQSIDLFYSVPFELGTWTLSVTNIQTALGDTLQPPTSLAFNVSILASQMPVNGGGENLDAESIMRKHFNPVLIGKGWNAIIAALAVSDQRNWDNAQLARKQMTISGASDKYLDQRANDQGAQRPKNIGIPDDLFRRLVIKTKNLKQVQQAMLEVLEIFYGADSVRAHIDTELVEPFDLTDGDNLTIVIDGKYTFPVTFKASDFARIGLATGIEVAAVLTRTFRSLGSNAYALPITDISTGQTKVRIYSGSLGLASSVQVIGGRAQNGLHFSTFLDITQLATYTVTFIPATGRTRFAVDDPTNLSGLHEGDYVNIYGGFNAANQGSFPVVAVKRYRSGGVNHNWFEIENRGVNETYTIADVDEIQYFRPFRGTIIESGVVVSQGDGITDIVIPATTQAVGRDLYTGAYLHDTPASTLFSLTRRFDGSVLGVVNSGHNLLVNDQIFIDGSRGDNTLPSLALGSPGVSAHGLGTVLSTLTSSLSNQGRVYHSATKLADGRVLLAGGYQTQTGAARTACDLFSITGSVVNTNGTAYNYGWTAGATIPHGVYDHRSLLLTHPSLNTRVLLVGGWDGTTAYQDAYLYTPNGGGGSWAATAGMGVGNERVGFGMSALSDKRILVSGGMKTVGPGVQSSAQIYDPSTATWSTTGSLLQGRCQHTQVTLGNGNVLVIGGRTLASGQYAWTNNTNMGPLLATCEIFNGTTWGTTGQMSYARFGHATIVLPDGRVLVAGGWGYLVRDGGNPQMLTTCEVYDPNLGIWTPGPSLLVAQAFADMAYDSVNNRIYLAGGNTATTITYPIQWLNLRTFKWHYSLGGATFTNGNRSNALLTQVTPQTFLLSGGYQQDGTTPATGSLLIPSSELSSSGRLNGTYRVTSVVNNTTFIASPNGPKDLSYTNSQASVATFVKLASLADTTIPGPYVVSPNEGFAVTSVESTITQALYDTRQYNSVNVADATVFPDKEGWLVFDFGGKSVGPVKYMGRGSSTSLVLDYSFVFPVDIASGALVTLLAYRGPWVPDDPTMIGMFYLTDAPAGRVAAEDAIDDVKAAGFEVRKTVVYPGDRGLGNEGYPAKGYYKISDKVRVWAGDNPDEEAAAQVEAD